MSISKNFTEKNYFLFFKHNSGKTYVLYIHFVFFFIKKFFYKLKNCETIKLIIRMKQISLLFVSFVVFLFCFLVYYLTELNITIVFSSLHV